MKNLKKLLVQLAEAIIVKFASQNVIDAITTRLASPEVVKSLATENIIKKVASEGLIIRMYRALITKQTLTISAELVKIKKGKVRYKLLKVVTPKGIVTFKLSRHDLTEPFDQVLTV